MNVIQFFKDWLDNNEEKQKFRNAWINEKIGKFGWADGVDKYHADVAYEMYKLSKKVEELELKIK